MTKQRRTSCSWLSASLFTPPTLWLARSAAFGSDDESDESDEEEIAFTTELDDDMLEKIQNELSGEASDNFCSINNIQMDTNFDKLNYTSTGVVDTEYNIDI